MKRTNIMLVALCGATLATSSARAGIVSLTVKGLGGYCLYKFIEGASNKRLSTFIKRQNLFWDAVQSMGKGVESFGVGTRGFCIHSMSSKQKKFFRDLGKNIKKEVKTSFSTVKNEWKKRQQVRKAKILKASKE